MQGERHAESLELQLRPFGRVGEQVDVHLVIASGLVGHVALPAVVVLHLMLEGAKSGGLGQLGALALQSLLVDRNVHRLTTPCRA